VNSDGVAVAVAEALKAIKADFHHAQDGILVQGRLIRQMLVADLNPAALQKATFSPEQLSKAQHAVPPARPAFRASTSSMARWTKGLLAEVFSNDGIGTLIYANEYQQIRPREEKGHPGDPTADEGGGRGGGTGQAHAGDD
jgi:amino-acid N-acetyltransferase